MTDVYARSIRRYLLEFITNGRRRGADGVGDKAATGEEFVTFSPISRSATAPSIFYPTMSEAKDLFMGAWKLYSKGKPNHVLYIRQAPEVVHENGLYTVYARLLLSEKEIKP